MFIIHYRFRYTFITVQIVLVQHLDIYTFGAVFYGNGSGDQFQIRSNGINGGLDIFTITQLIIMELRLIEELKKILHI